jgi:plastocyanin
MSTRSMVIHRTAVCCLATAVMLTTPHLANAAAWHATIGAQNHDKGHQALAFLPNEIWIHVNDTIMWTSNVDELHTVTFLTDGQIWPFFDPNPCPPPIPATFNGAACVSTPVLFKGDTFTLKFTGTGNFKLVCLLHENMTGVIHVLAAGATLPHDQRFYDEEAKHEAHALLHDDDGGRGGPKVLTEGAAANGPAPGGPHHDHAVTVGVGEVTSTPGGKETFSILRFINDDIVIHVGETVEFTNHDPVTPHTITFGAEPGDLPDPSGTGPDDPDGARHAIINSPSDNVHSGFIVAAAQDELGKPQTPVGVTRFRVTFTHPDTYPYICALHEDLGMKGRIIVVP